LSALEDARMASESSESRGSIRKAGPIDSREGLLRAAAALALNGPGRVRPVQVQVRKTWG